MKGQRDAETIRAEGWKWVEMAISFPYGHTYGMRVISGQQRAPTTEEDTAVAACQAEMEKIEETYQEADEYPDEVAERLAEIEEALEAINNRPLIMMPLTSPAPACLSASTGRASCGSSAAMSGARMSRRCPRSKPAIHDTSDEVPTDGEAPDGPEADVSDTRRAAVAISNDAEPEEDGGIRPLSDKLLTELTAYRTLALHEAVGNDHHPRLQPVRTFASFAESGERHLNSDCRAT